MQIDLGHINKIAVVHVVLEQDRAIFHCTLLKKSKGEIHFLKKMEALQSVEDVIKQVGKQIPFLLHFSGKGVLNRSTKNQENYRRAMLMNASLSTFYFTDYKTDQTVFSSVLRKDVVEEYLNHFTAKKTIVIAVSSGPFVAAVLSSIFQNKPVTTCGASLKLEDETLIGFEKDEGGENQSSFMIGEERISSNLIPCAAIGAQFFFPSTSLLIPNEETPFVAAHEEAKQRNIFIRFGMGMMVFFLLLLTVNYFYLGSLYAEINQNQIFLDENSEQSSKITILKEEKIRKEKLLRSSGLLNKHFLSYYLMELGNSVPKEIVFEQINVRPLVDEIKPRHKLEFDDRLVRVYGRAHTSHDLSRWIERLEEEDWLTKVDILSYEYVKGEGLFELELIVF